MIEHFRFLKSVAKAVPKMTIPSPTALHYRGGRQAIERSVYPEMEPFFADLGRAYGKAVRAFGEAGCTYLQLDEVFVAYLCDRRRSATICAAAATIPTSCCMSMPTW